MIPAIERKQESTPDSFNNVLFESNYFCDTLLAKFMTTDLLIVCLAHVLETNEFPIAVLRGGGRRIQKDTWRNYVHVGVLNGPHIFV